MRAPLEIPPLTAEELEALEKLYRTTKDVRLRTRTQIVLLAGEQRLRASAIAPIVREATQTVRNWLKRWVAEGIARAERSTHARSAAENHGRVSRALAVGGPASTSQLGATLFDVDSATACRLHGGADRHSSLY